MEIAESIIIHIAEISVLLFDIVSIFIMLWGGIRALSVLLRRRKGSVNLTLSGYMNLALLFKMGAEVVRLSYVRTLAELGVVSGIVALHGAISFIIHWEKKRDREEAKVAKEEGLAGDELLDKII